MDTWEYLVVVVTAGASNANAVSYVRGKLESLPVLTRYAALPIGSRSPALTVFFLDSLGQEGWELLSMQPIAGVDSDASLVLLDAKSLQQAVNQVVPIGFATFFCVFKRRMRMDSGTPGDGGDQVESAG